MSKPVANRLFFNDYGIKITSNLEVKASKLQDSTYITIRAVNKVPNADLSMSILPASASGINTNYNILSKFYLEPFVDGFIENSISYFGVLNNNQVNKINQLLLSQGSKRYLQDGFKLRKKKAYDFEQGITINLKNLKPNNYLFFPFENNNATYFPVNTGQSSYRIENLYPLKGEKILLAIINDEKKNVYP